MPYTGSPATSSTDAVRLRLGDTATAVGPDLLLTDVEYTYFLDLVGGGILPAAIQGARAIAAKFMRQPRVAHGPSAVDPTKTADYFLRLADELEAEISISADMDAGGVSKADKQATEADADRVPTVFSVGQDDRRGTRDGNSPDECW